MKKDLIYNCQAKSLYFKFYNIAFKHRLSNDENFRTYLFFLEQNTDLEYRCRFPKILRILCELNRKHPGRNIVKKVLKSNSVYILKIILSKDRRKSANFARKKIQKYANFIKGLLKHNNCLPGDVFVRPPAHITP